MTISNITPARTAEQLMRSRYAAFVSVDVAHIVQTTLPMQQSHLDQPDIKEWATTTQWAGLEVLSHTAKLGKRHAQVEFKAFYTTETGRQQHHELSTFVMVDGRWYFIDPNALEKMNITQKQACICGSDYKFKQCCGKFL